MGTTAYKEGWKAKGGLEPLKANPYPKNTRERKDWAWGWYDAQRDPALMAELGTELYFAGRY